MQKIKRTETLLESQGFFRFSSAIDVLMRDGLVHGQVVQYSPGEGINQAIGFKSVISPLSVTGSITDRKICTYFWGRVSQNRIMCTFIVLRGGPGC